MAGARAKELLAELTDAVLLARVAPGQRLTQGEFAALGRASAVELATVLPVLAASGLVSIDGEQVLVRPLDPNAVLATLPRRMELELRIVRAVVVSASDVQLKEMQASEAMLRRCATLGDMDGMMHAERQLEALMAEASGLQSEALELTAIKREFRRAWCAANRLRTFTHVASIRTALVAAIAARDVQAAEKQVLVFFDHLLSTY
jgi:DNA-binding GntR family transcriptional regulator